MMVLRMTREVEEFINNLLLFHSKSERQVFTKSQKNFLPLFSGRIQTLELRKMSQLLYHCATGQLFADISEPTRAEPFMILCCIGRLMALPRNVRLERFADISGAY
jgi:hypothetical protein